MVTLSTHLIQLFDQAQIANRNAGDLYALGKWHADQDQIEQAETYLRQAMASAEDVETRHAAALRLAAIYKQIDRRSEALPLWEAATDRATTLAVEACSELAKHYEWHDRQLKRAMKWTQQGLKLAAKLPSSPARAEAEAALEHRLERLGQKLKGK